MQICNSFAATAKLQVELPLLSAVHRPPALRFAERETLQLAFKYVTGLLSHSVIETLICIINVRILSVRYNEFFFLLEMFSPERSVRSVEIYLDGKKLHIFIQ